MIKLNVGERLTLTGVIPQEGNFDTMDTVEKLKKILYLSEEEVKKFGLELGADQLPVEVLKEETQVDISELGMALIMKSLKKLDEGEKLDQYQFRVYKHLKEIEQEKKQKEQKKSAKS